MKYKVLIVDDEPSAIQYIKKIIELKCADYEVSGTALSGADAVKWLETNTANVLVTDVCMPDMDGIELANYTREHYSDIESVVISGYQDFEFLQGAIRAKVCDYLLKPINPSQLKELFLKIKERLDKKYYERRNRLIHRMCSGESPAKIDEKELEDLFPEPFYYSAIIRRNGMISRFRDSAEREFFSLEKEQMIIYGRDNRETLYIYPKDLIGDDFSFVMNHAFFKMRDESSYLTMVVKEEAFKINELPEVINRLYFELDQSIVIGLDQKLILGKRKSGRNEEKSEKQFELIMYHIRNRNLPQILNELKALFGCWEYEERSQFRIEEKLRYIFYEMQINGIMSQYDAYFFEDMFSGVVNMTELYNNIYEFIQQYAADKSHERRDDRKEIFDGIVLYIKRHISEKLSVQGICGEFGISQATLSRLFRKYAEMSYNSYLTETRINIARALLEDQSSMFIKDVAATVGYDDQFYFSRIFRSFTGMSPSDYVEQIRFR